MSQVLERCGHRDLCLNSTRAAYNLYVSLGFTKEAIVYMRQGEAPLRLPTLPALEGELSELASVVREERHQAGATIVRQGDFGDCMYVIDAGEVDITAEGQLLARMGSREYFGEMSLLTGDPRTATVSTTRDSVLIEIPAESFRGIALEDPTVLDAISTAVVTRRAGLDKTRAAALTEGALRDQSSSLIGRVRRFLRLPGA